MIVRDATGQARRSARIPGSSFHCAKPGVFDRLGGADLIGEDPSDIAGVNAVTRRKRWLTAANTCSTRLRILDRPTCLPLARRHRVCRL